MKKLVFLVWLVILNSEVQSQASEPILFREKLFDFGEVKERAGPVMHEFTFTNLTGRPVKILGVQASCGCTTSGWSQEPIAAGKAGFVKANFDPQGRPGYFSKTLTVTTDYDGTTIVLQIKGNVVNGATEAKIADWPAASGNLRLKFNSFNLGKLYINRDPSLVRFNVYNSGSNPIHFKVVQGPKYLKTTTPPVLKPGESADITFQFDARAKGQYGFVSENIAIETDDELQPLKSFSVYATIEESFPQLSSEDLAKSPTLSLDISSIEFGNAKQEVKLQREFKIRNTGKKDLLIRSLQSNCSCLTYDLTKMKLTPGQEATLNINLSTSQRTGPLQKALTIYSNDPKAPVQRVTVTALVN